MENIADSVAYNIRNIRKRATQVGDGTGLIPAAFGLNASVKNSISQIELVVNRKV